MTEINSKFSKKQIGNETAINFEMYYQKYILELFNKAISMFEWSGLPPEIDYRFIEHTLMSYGLGLIYFNDDMGEFVFTKTTFGGGMLDIYNIPEIRSSYAVTGFLGTFNEKNSVMMFNNYVRSPILSDIYIYARELATIKCTMEMNRFLQRIPKYILTNDNRLLTSLNLKNDISQFKPFVVLDQAFDPETVGTIDSSVPFLLDKLRQDFKDTYKEFMEFIGFETGSDKKERVVKEENQQDNSIAKAQRNSFLKARQQACEKMNELFGWDVSVKFSSNLTNDYGEIQKEEKEINELGEGVDE